MGGSNRAVSDRYIQNGGGHPADRPEGRVAAVVFGHEAPTGKWSEDIPLLSVSPEYSPLFTLL